MGLEDELKEREKEQKKYIPLNEVPSKIKAKIVDYKFKEDSRGNECFYMYLKTPEGNIVVQKYTPTGFKELRVALEKVGSAKTLQSKFVTWEQKMLGRNKFPRLVPVAPKTDVAV